MSVFTVVLAVALFALVGLVVDVGRAIAARCAAIDQAEQAARAGADQLSVSAIRSGQISLDPAAAIAAADSYLGALGDSGSTRVTGDVVTVTIEGSEPTVMLGIVGIRQISISAVASATDVHGVSEPD